MQTMKSVQTGAPGALEVVDRTRPADATPIRSRQAPTATVAFVLQGGGSLAAGQVGMLRALFEAGVRPDLLIGSSAGALNAVAFAQNPTTAGLDELHELWSRLRRSDVF